MKGADVMVRRFQMGTLLGQVASINDFFKISGLIKIKGIACGLVHRSTKNYGSLWFCSWII